MSFSDRMGITTPSKLIQLGSMNDALNNKLWNLLHSYFFKPIEEEYYFVNLSISSKSFIFSLNHIFFKKRADQNPENSSTIVYQISKWYFQEAQWFQKYNFLEFCSNQIDDFVDKEKFESASNKILENEVSGYRFINGEIAPIINKNEIESIENAIQNADKNSLVGVKTHLENSLKKLSNKPNPDYANSVKESISAVESICKSISGEKGADLTKALQKIKDSIGMHPAFSDALKKLYAYTSDEGGVRHGLMDESNLDQEDAVFMLVTCSAFINYMIVKNDKVEKLRSTKK